jgi:hypothetical protein
MNGTVGKVENLDKGKMKVTVKFFVDGAPK